MCQAIFRQMITTKNTVSQQHEHRHALTRKQAKLPKNLAHQEAQLIQQMAILIQVPHRPHG